mgnify:CR=1 FL=1
MNNQQNLGLDIFRISGFVLMVLVLWSPVVVPLLPTLVQSWATHNSPRIAELACLVGLCVSIMLMVTLWGKRIRGYDNPLEQYGLDLTSPSKVWTFLINCCMFIEKYAIFYHFWIVANLLSILVLLFNEAI